MGTPADFEGLERLLRALFCVCARQGRTRLEVKVLCRPDRGNCRPSGKGKYLVPRFVNGNRSCP